MKWGLLAVMLCAPVSAQVDPAKRRLIQFGSDLPLSGNGPFGGYAFYYHNQPGVRGDGTALRLAVAPVYADTEYATSLAPNIDLGLGLFGGGFAQGHQEIRAGHLYKDESFHGHGFGASGSLYVRLNPGDMIPVSTILRVTGQRTYFERRSATRRDFILPEDHDVFSTRMGIRAGGQEPLLEPSRAGELSAWYDTRYRTRKGLYGLNRDRDLQRETHFYWVRALVAYTFAETGRSFNSSIVTGASYRADRMNAYKIGGTLPLASEFPLSIPGYYNRELSVTRFFLMNGRVGMPLDEARRFGANFYGAGGWMKEVPGMGQAGAFNSGLGASLDYESPWRVWRMEFGYGYGFQAMRSGNRGSHSVSILVQCDLEAQAFRDKKLKRRKIQPALQQGLDWLLRR